MARDRAESTIYCYRNIVRCHVAPALGAVPISQLTPLRIQSYLHEKMDQGLSPNTVHKHYVLLTTALGLAVRLELLERSPMDRVCAPKLQETRYTFYTPRPAPMPVFRSGRHHAGAAGKTGCVSGTAAQ